MKNELHRFRVLVIVLSALTTACGDSGAPPIASDGGATRDASGDSGAALDAGNDVATVAYLRGIYFVPDRSDVSTYPVAEVTWSVARGRATLAYNLPRMLVGGSERVALSGPLSTDAMSAVLTGPRGTGTCSLATSGMLLRCDERFTDIAVDLGRVREEAMADDPARVDGRVAVATRFSVDPIGVLEISEYVRPPAPAVPCTLDSECGASGRCDVEVPPEVGFCEVHGTTAVGGTCESQLDCALDLECELAFGATTGTCAPHGGG